MTDKQNLADEATTYNQEEAIATIQSFFEFLVRMHAGVDASHICLPPAVGCPEINREVFRTLGHNDRTIDFLRHLPYFRCGGIGGVPQIMSDTWTVDGLKNCPQDVDDLRLPEGEDPADVPLPRHIVPIAEGEEYGYTIYLDTNRGTIILAKNDNHWPSTKPIGDVESYPYEGDLNLDEVGGADIDVYNAWLFGGTFRVKTFFDVCKERFSSLTWIPIMEEGYQGNVIELNDFDHVPEFMVERQEILRRAGWPGEGWDKSKAIRETTEWRRQCDDRYRY